MKRGEVYSATLVPRSGSEQKGRRPVIILSHDAFNDNANWRSIIVIPVSTSSAQAKRGPTSVVIPRRNGGLKQDSVALCHQVTTLDRSKLTQRLGSLPAAIVTQIEDGLLAALSILRD